MAEYIERESILKRFSSYIEDFGYGDRQNKKLSQISVEDAMMIIEDEPAADARPERHGHIVWKERHSGGFRERKCLTDYGYSIFTPPCNRVARIDDRCTENKPYCSECGKLLGDFLSYCGNCGAKMDGKDGENNG